MTYFIYQNDIPSDVEFKDIVAIDTETMGLKFHRDRLCMIQLSGGDGKAHLVQVSREELEKKDKFVNLKKILSNEKLTKLFHFARFDIAVLENNVCKIHGPVYCTKIASKLCRTFGARHGLSDLCRDILDLELNKQNQTSDWGSRELNDSQLKYAASDVLYLHKIKEKLDLMLERENRKELAEACFKFLKTRAEMDLIGFNDLDIFSH